MFLQPGGSAQCLRIAAACQLLMTFWIELLHVKQYQVSQPQEFFHMLVPHAPVAVQADVYALCLQVTEKGNQGFGLHGGFSAAEGDASFLTEERLLADSHFQYLRRPCLFAFAHGVYGVGVGTIEAAEGTSLQKDDEPETRPVECSHTFVGVNFNHIKLTFFRGTNG